MPSRTLSILLTAAMLLQSLLCGIASAGTICLGGGHEHPEEADTAGCELDCVHAPGRTPLPTLVLENHTDCSCVDLDLSLSELLSTSPRSESVLSPLLLPAMPIELWVVQTDWTPRPCLPPAPDWFDPGVAQHISHLSTTRLIV